MNGVSISPQGFQSQFDSYDSDAILTEYEKKALSYIEEAFEENGLPFSELRFRRRSDSYLSVLALNDMDFLRIKASERSVWFSVHGLHLSPELKSDARFDGVKKTLIHWKVKLKDVDDLKDNTDLIIESYLSIRNK